MNAIKKKSINYLVLGFFILTLSSFGAINAFSNDSTAHAAEIHATDSVSPAHSEEVHAPAAEHTEKEGIDAGKLIMEHIGDAHDWHMATIGHTHVTLPLPIIIKDAAGFHIFSSSKFHHGHDAYNGYKLEHGKIVAVNEDGSINESASFFDLSITKNVAAMLISVFVLIWMMLSVASSYKKGKGAAPKGFANLIEMGILFIRDEVAKPSIGPKYMKFMPYLLTIFFFIFLNNLFGLVPFFPGGANVTGNIAVTLVLALFTFVITSINGNKSYWGHIFMPPGVPKALWILLVPIEIIGMLNKPIVLMIRLFANITAGHIIMLGFFSLIFIFGAMSEGLGLGVSVMSVAFTTFMNFLELLVAFLQAYVFTLLSALYFGSAVEEHAHHDEHH